MSDLDHCIFCHEELHWYSMEECPELYHPGCGEVAYVCGAHAILVENDRWQELLEQWDKRDWSSLDHAEKSRRLGGS